MLSWRDLRSRLSGVKWRSYFVALLIVAIASGLRIAFLSDLGRGTAYLTYYPAVMLAALYGGISTGILATATSALLCFYWIQQGYMSSIETLAMAVFVFSCSMISGIAEAMRRAQARAKKEKERAEAANLAKSGFLARMSHELRTPMNAILGFTEIMRRDPGISKEQQKNLEIINRSGKHLLDLINDVLDMAKIDADRMVIENSAFDLGEMVRETTELMRIRAEEKNLQLMLDQPPDLPRFVHADEGKLRQAIINLVGNAIKFTEQGGVTLRLRTLAADSPGRLLLTMEVEDSGIGISASDQERVFEPFVQVSNLPLQKGTGLGLAITKKSVELLGGRISLQSAPDKGTTFRVEVPVGLADAADVSAPAAEGRVISLTPGQPEYRILIVEDQEENWMLLQQLQERVGLKVRVAEDGLAGIEAFEAWRPHLIWMDIRMPVMDGLEATRRIRRREGGQAVKIVAITASVFKEEIDSVKAAGMDDLVRKPYRADEIYDCLTKYLGASFVRAETTPAISATEPAMALKPEALAGLPGPLREELGNALIALDTGQIAAVIARVAEANRELGRALTAHAERLNYTAIMQALKAGAGDSSAEKAVS